jgi:hypothetical protein
MEAVLQAGPRLDKVVQDLLRQVGQRTLQMVYAAVETQLVAQAQAAGGYVERRPTVVFKTVFGPIEICSPYLRTADSSRGWRPLKEAMGVVGNRWSEAVERALVDFGSERSFARAAQQFAEHYGWEPGPSAVLRATEAVAVDAERFLV